MSNLKLTIATTDYDHFRDFRLGFVKAEGIDHTWLNLGHHECFARFTANREFDVSEGDAYNRALVDRSERRLKNLDFFKSVKITTEPGSSTDRVILVVDLE